MLEFMDQRFISNKPKWSLYGIIQECSFSPKEGRKKGKGRRKDETEYKYQNDRFK